MLKVTFIITNLSTGGAEHMLLKLLQQIDRKRFEVMVVSLVGMGEIGPRIEELGIPVCAMGMRNGAIPSPVQFLGLVRLLRQYQPDVVHTWMYHADLLGGLAARLAGCHRVLWCIRNSNLDARLTSRTTLWVAKACALLSSLLPTRIISCSVRAKDIHVGIGYSAEKMQIIPNGFQLSRYKPDIGFRSNVRSELGLAEDTPLVGLIARYDPQKNHLGFVQAAARVAKTLPKVHFLLAGKDVEGKNEVLQAAIAAQGLQSRMHLLGRRDDIPRLMASLDVLASSSSYGEAFPNVLGEAMACGVPCVVTDVGDSADIVGETGKVVPPGDMEGLAYELVAVLQLPADEKALLNARARARVEHEYGIGIVTQLYEACYEQVLMLARKEQV